LHGHRRLLSLSDHSHNSREEEEPKKPPPPPPTATSGGFQPALTSIWTEEGEGKRNERKRKDECVFVRVGTAGERRREGGGELPRELLQVKTKNMFLR
jgi:hypothetical protein